jgi:hypothetical protein
LISFGCVVLIRRRHKRVTPRDDFPMQGTCQRKNFILPMNRSDLLRKPCAVENFRADVAHSRLGLDSAQFFY